MSKGEYFEAQRSVIGSMLIDGEHVAGIVMHRSREEDYTGEYLSLIHIWFLWLLLLCSGLSQIAHVAQRLLLKLWRK